jgi:hypothetical protein
VLLGTIFAVGQSFFPVGAFYPGDRKLDAFVANWYSGQLTALQEPSLFEMKQDSDLQSYRFLWLRTFHHPISVRVLIHKDGSGVIVTKVADGAGGYKPGKLIVNKTESLTPEGVKNLVDKIKQLSFWTLQERDNSSIGADGAQWIVEGVDQGKYRLVDRWSPQKDPVRELGLYFLRDLSGLDMKAEEIY